MKFKRLREWRYPEPTPWYVWALARIEGSIRMRVFLWRLRRQR